MTLCASAVPAQPPPPAPSQLPQPVDPVDRRDWEDYGMDDSSVRGGGRLRADLPGICMFTWTKEQTTSRGTSPAPDQLLLFMRDREDWVSSQLYENL